MTISGAADERDDDGALCEVGIDSEAVFDGRLLKVFRDRVRLPDGSESTREWIRHPGAVAIIAVHDDGSLVFERQFRYPVGQVFLEIPAGKLDAGESTLACAQRELREETGFVAECWEHVGTIHPCIGYSNEHIEVFFAKTLSQHGAQLDPGEFLRVIRLSPAELDAAVGAGQLTDAKTLAALYFARSRGCFA